ncbi:phosphopantetheine-binding protein, partial [Streptomyces sp. NPDC017524]|uniref:phosphopantetheine-binding protein n=1 Tax=Streptomyces sp. NPDC017524 TaxID=3364999 RepID=UPI0037BA0827
TAHLTDHDLARMNRTAIRPLTNTHALQLFDAQEHHHRPVRMVCNLDTERLPMLPVFSRLATVRQTAGTAQQGPALTDQLAGLTPTEQHEHLLTLIRRHAAQILTLDSPTTIEPGRGFLDQGLDSLTAVELRNRLSTATGIRLPATTIFDHPTPIALTEHLHHQLAPTTTDTTQEQSSRAVERVLSALDGIKGMLAAVPVSDVTATQIPAQLHALLAELDESVGSAAEGDVADQLEAASAEDLFKFIDSEL